MHINVTLKSQPQSLEYYSLSIITLINSSIIIIFDFGPLMLFNKKLCRPILILRTLNLSLKNDEKKYRLTLTTSTNVTIITANSQANSHCAD